MTTNIDIKSYLEPEFNIREAARYAGLPKGNTELDELILQCFGECRANLSYKVCYKEYKVKRDGELLDLGFAKVKSADLSKNLEGCESIILFCSTVGLNIDRLIKRYAGISEVKSLMFQAIGAERAEALCQVFTKDIKEALMASGKCTVPRFSPGYGDLPLSLQTDIFNALKPEGKIGLTLNQSLLMSPTKSVSAIIGIKNKTEQINK